MAQTRLVDEDDKYAMKQNRVRYPMSGEDVRKELLELRERVVKLEVRVDELAKRIDNQSNYMRQLYDYLQKRTGR